MSVEESSTPRDLFSAPPAAPHQVIPAPAKHQSPARARGTSAVAGAARWWVWISAGFMVIGGYCAWATIGSVSVGGTVGDGWFVILAGAGGAVLFHATRGSRSAGAWPLIGGVVGLAITAYDRSHLESFINHGGVPAFEQPQVHVGWGLNVALIASISMAVAGVVSLLQRRT